MQKEKELHDINEYRIHTLETLLQEKEREIADSKARLSKLKDDFNYNLKLLEERDSELERYDSSFNNLKAVIRDRDIEQCFAAFNQSKWIGLIILMGLCGHFWVGASAG